MLGSVITGIVVNAVALFLTIRFVPGLAWPGLSSPGSLSTPRELVSLIAVAAIFGLLNTYVKPIVKMLSLPVSLMTVGLFGFVINAALFLLLAVIANGIGVAFKVGGFPPTFTAQTIVSAVLGAIVVSIVGAVLVRFIDRG